jgi:hypothetical protein
MHQKVLLKDPKKKTKNRKNRQKHYYSGKKKRHTLKTQVVVNKKNAKILALDFSNGKQHDFKLFKESKIRIASNTQVLADTGYVGIKDIINNAIIPHKRSKKCRLTKEQKKENHEISSKRVLCENVIGSVKRFRILSERYRNRRKRFGLRFSLIAGIHNYELDV